MHACPENGHFVFCVIFLVFTITNKPHCRNILSFGYAAVTTYYTETTRIRFHQMEQYCQVKRFRVQGSALKACKDKTRNSKPQTFSSTMLFHFTAWSLDWIGCFDDWASSCLYSGRVPRPILPLCRWRPSLIPVTPKIRFCHGSVVANLFGRVRLIGRWRNAGG
jgi:hypothetical protein